MRATRCLIAAAAFALALGGAQGAGVADKARDVQRFDEVDDAAGGATLAGRVRGRTVPRCP